MADVARVAGVSHQTVSRVLNEHPSVRPETRARVRQAIEKLGYRPNLAARALATGRSRTLGVVTLDTILYGPVATLYGIERAARAQGYFVSVVSLRSIERSSLEDAVSRLVEQAVAGVIFIAPLASATEALTVVPADLPIVVVAGEPALDVPSVAVDNRAGARAATEVLLALGHRTVWHVSGPVEWLEARQRADGWRSALVDAGAEVPEPLEGDWTAATGYRAGRILADKPALTAVFVANDQMALGLLRAMAELGRKVPDDVSVIGFDDIGEAEYFTPPLTTVHQDFELVGERCLDLLLEQLEPTPPVRPRTKTVLRPRVVLRASAASPS